MFWIEEEVSLKKELIIIIVEMKMMVERGSYGWNICGFKENDIIDIIRK